MKITEQKKRVSIIQQLGFKKVDAFTYSLAGVQDIKYVDLVNMSPEAFTVYIKSLMKQEMVSKQNLFYGKLQYTEDGKPHCHICGSAEHSLYLHTLKAHGVPAAYYKMIFGLAKKTGLISDSYRAKKVAAISQKTIEAFKKGCKKSRFTKGNPGRTKDQVSPQTKNKLLDSLATANLSKEKRKEIRDKGLSGFTTKK